MSDSKTSQKKDKSDKAYKKEIKNREDGSSQSSASEEEDEEGQQIGKGLATAEATISREEYLQAHRDLTFDKSQLQIKNNILHRRLAEYYRKRRLEHVLKPLEGAVDLEEKYQQKLITYEELKEKDERELVDIKSKVTEVELKYYDRHEYVQKKFEELQQLEKNTGTGLIYSKKGKPIADKTVYRFLLLQKKKQEQTSNLRLRYIRARNAVSELEAIVRKLEKLGPGLYVTEYEQLSIDNQNYFTKIEERDDELIRNRSKCTEHNQILAHIREKMHHTDEVIDFAECDLGDAEIEFLRAREDLGQVKGRRDKLRWSLQAERRKAGLLTRKDLLRDFQDATDEVILLKQKKVLLEKEIETTTHQLREARSRMLIHSTPAKSLPPSEALICHCDEEEQGPSQ